MTLFDLLTVISFVTPIGGAFGAAKRDHLSIGGYLVTSLLGLLLGVLFAWCLRASAMALAPRLQAMGKLVQRACTISYLCMSVLWPLLGVFAGALTVKAVFG